MAEAIASAREERGHAPVIGDEEVVTQAPGPPVGWPKRIGRWLREHPMADPRFSFFIFVLIPVQTF